MSTAAKAPALALTPGLGAPAQTGWLPAPASLERLAAALAAKGQPLVLMVSLVDCPFCHRVRGSEIRPRQQHEGLVVAEIDISGPRTLLGFDGASLTQRELARRYNVRVAPTLLWLDPRPSNSRGEELAERLVGASIPDFYGAYFDERQRAATAQLARVR